MGVQGLTIYHVKSHLQKYRLAKYVPDSASDGGTSKVDQKSNKKKNPAAAAQPDIILPASDSTSGVQVDDALRMQMEVQKRLHEQLEVQRHLQLRIDAQSKYLKKIIEEQQRVGGSTNTTTTTTTHDDTKLHTVAAASVNERGLGRSHSLMAAAADDQEPSSNEEVCIVCQDDDDDKKQQQHDQHQIPDLRLSVVVTPGEEAGIVTDDDAYKLACSKASSNEQAGASISPPGIRELHFEIMRSSESTTSQASSARTTTQLQQQQQQQQQHQSTRVAQYNMGTGSLYTASLNSTFTSSWTPSSQSPSKRTRFAGHGEIVATGQQPGSSQSVSSELEPVVQQHDGGIMVATCTTSSGGSDFQHQSIHLVQRVVTPGFPLSSPASNCDHSDFKLAMDFPLGGGSSSSNLQQAPPANLAAALYTSQTSDLHSLTGDDLTLRPLRSSSSSLQGSHIVAMDQQWAERPSTTTAESDSASDAVRQMFSRWEENSGNAVAHSQGKT
ncbi:hypothetical protein BDL97_09G047400 [Sphagnum fallax]|nr:hypothetical protein BDL97_09G047400 [Sphagnum fallax]